MKTKIFIVSLAFCGIAGAQSWQWAKSAGGSKWDGAQSVIADMSGNIYVTGFFTGPISFGSISLPVADSITTNFFLVKYDPTGNALWAKASIGNNSDAGQSIAIDNNGNIIVIGTFFSDTIKFDTTILVNSVLGQAEIFIAKYDSSGNLMWAKSAGENNSQDYGQCVTADAAGDVYVSGFFSDAITFDTITLFSAGNYDIYMAKYDASGNVIWAKSFGGSDYDGANGITSDVSGNIFITGYFNSSSIGFGSIFLNNAGFNNADVFITKFDAAGNVIWAQSAGGNSDDKGNALTSDANGFIYITGDFGSSTISFGSKVLTNSSAGNYDVFMVKFNSAGNTIWANFAGGLFSDWSLAITTDSVGGVYATGYFTSSFLAFGSDTVVNTGGSDIFLIKCDASGNAVGATAAGGYNNEEEYDVATDAMGNVYIAGNFYSSSLNFGSTNLINTDATGFTPDIFVAKLSSGMGTNTINKADPALVYPNPTSGLFQMTNLPSACVIEIANVLCEKIYSSKTSADKTDIDLSGQPGGIYYYRIFSGKKIISSGKLAVQ